MVYAPYLLFQVMIMMFVIGMYWFAYGEVVGDEGGGPWGLCEWELFVICVYMFFLFFLFVLLLLPSMNIVMVVEDLEHVWYHRCGR